MARPARNPGDWRGCSQPPGPQWTYVEWARHYDTVISPAHLVVVQCRA